MRWDCKAIPNGTCYGCSFCGPSPRTVDFLKRYDILPDLREGISVFLEDYFAISGDLNAELSPNILELLSGTLKIDFVPPGGALAAVADKGAPYLAELILVCFILDLVRCRSVIGNSSIELSVMILTPGLVLNASSVADCTKVGNF